MSAVGKVKNVLKGYARNHETFRKAARKASLFYAEHKYKRGSKKVPTDDHLIYFNTFNGKSYGDTPKALYELMLDDTYFDDYHFVWMFSEPEKYGFLKNNRDTFLVKKDTKAADRAVQRAAYWITNYRMSDRYIPKDDQTYVQCWHGTPLKRLGFDLDHSDNAMNSSDEIFDKYYRDTVRLKYLISPSPFATGKFISAWRLDVYGKTGAIIEEGYPRNDRLINAGPDEIAGLKKQLGLVETGGRKIILYAPTWRDNQYTNGVGYTYKAEVDFDYLSEQLEDDYIILFRAHYLVENEFDFEKYKGFVYNVSHHDDINDLFLVSDILITDYSSVFFDYANLERPMVFFMYDIEDYRDNIRGFYIDLDELPGPIAEDENSLVNAVKSIPDSFKPDEKYNSFRKKYNPKDDGKASERTLDRIFNR